MLGDINLIFLRVGTYGYPDSPACAARVLSDGFQIATLYYSIKYRADCSFFYFAFCPSTRAPGLPARLVTYATCNLQT